jgi:hypothetical protein
MSLSPLKAIHQLCFSCVVDEQPGNGTKCEQTEACTSYKCALYEFRPVTLAEKSRRNDEKLKGMTKAELATYEENKEVKAAIFRGRINKAAHLTDQDKESGLQTNDLDITDSGDLSQISP